MAQINTGLTGAGAEKQEQGGKESKRGDTERKGERLSESEGGGEMQILT